MEPWPERHRERVSTGSKSSLHYINPLRRIPRRPRYYLSATIKSRSWNFPIHNLFNFTVKISEQRSRNMFPVNILSRDWRRYELYPFFLPLIRANSWLLILRGTFIRRRFYRRPWGNADSGRRFSKTFRLLQMHMRRAKLEGWVKHERYGLLHVLLYVASCCCYLRVQWENMD